MSVWKDESDFLRDIERFSEFYVSGAHNEPSKKFVFKSRKAQSPQTKSTLWYETDSDEETHFGFGRGRIHGNGVEKPGKEVNHLDVMRNIQMEVRSVVGNRYNNDVLESFYNVYKQENPDVSDVSNNIAPKEISISYAKELQERKTSPPNEQMKKLSISDRIESSVAGLTSSAPAGTSTSSSSNTSRKENRNYKRRQRPTISSDVQSFPFNKSINKLNVKSKQDFPPLN